jgi:hypothetical protein
VLGDSGNSWALKDTFVQSYLQTLLLKREKNKPSDIDISFCQSFYEIDIGKNEFGKESVWCRKPPKNEKPGQVVKRLSFVYGFPTSIVAKRMNAFVEAIKCLCFTMKLREHILSEVSLLNTSRNIIRVCLIVLQKIVTKWLLARVSLMMRTVISKAVSAIIIMRGSIVSWLIMTLFAY